MAAGYLPETKKSHGFYLVIDLLTYPGFLMYVQFLEMVAPQVVVLYTQQTPNPIKKELEANDQVNYEFAYLQHMIHQKLLLRLNIECSLCKFHSKEMQ